MLSAVSFHVCAVNSTSRCLSGVVLAAALTVWHSLFDVSSCMPCWSLLPRCCSLCTRVWHCCCFACCGLCLLLFLAALRTRHLFSPVCPAPSRLQEYVRSPYFEWYQPPMEGVAAAHLRAVEAVERHRDLPMEDGGACGRGRNVWPRQLAEGDLGALFPRPFYLARDNHYPQFPWLMANRRCVRAAAVCVMRRGTLCVRICSVPPPPPPCAHPQGFF